LLIDFFVRKFDHPEKQLTREALDILMKYDYPGNVRELENIVQRACVLSRGNTISTNDLPLNVRSLKAENNSSEFQPRIDDINMQVEALEKEIIKMALKETNGNQSKAAKLLNISERNLRYKLEKMKT
jgi:two-component system NtrC family response regulator